MDIDQRQGYSEIRIPLHVIKQLKKSPRKKFLVGGTPNPTKNGPQILENRLFQTKNQAHFRCEAEISVVLGELFNAPFLSTRGSGVFGFLFVKLQISKD